MAATEDYTIVGWDDTRHGDDVTHTQDIYTAGVQYRELGSGAPSWLLYLLAGFGGLMAVGLLLLTLTMVARRSGEPARAPA